MRPQRGFRNDRKDKDLRQADVDASHYFPTDKTDKAFLIAKPMGKATWTKRFAAGWGERGAANGRGELGQGG